MTQPSRDEELRSLRDAVARLQIELAKTSHRLDLLEEQSGAPPMASPVSGDSFKGEPQATWAPRTEPVAIPGPPPVIVRHDSLNSRGLETASAASRADHLASLASAAGMTAHAVGAKQAPPGVEMRIGATWFNRIGALILLAGVAFFVKYSFEQGWISPIVRVAMGAATGLLLIIGGQYSLRRGMRQFAVGLIGAGVAMLYVATFAAHIFYELISSDTAFGLYCVVSAMGTALAVHAPSQAIAVLTIIGAFATPPALNTHRNAQVALLTYLLIVDVGFLGVSGLRRWNIPRILCWLGTFFTFSSWGQAYYEPTALWTTLAFIVAFYIAFHAEALHSAKRNLGIEKWLLPGIIHANNIVFFMAVCALLEKQYHEYLGLFAVITGAAQWLLAWLIRRDDNASRPSQTSLCIDGAGILALAAPLQFDGRSVVIAWGVQAVVSLWFARRIPAVWLRVKAVGILFAAFVHLMCYEVDDESLAVRMVETRLWHLNKLILCFLFVGFSAYSGAICLSLRRTMSKVDKITAGLLIGFGTWLYLIICAQQYDRYVATWCWIVLCFAWALAARWTQAARVVAVILAFFIVAKFLAFDLADAADRTWQSIHGVVFNRVVLTSLFVAATSMLARRLSKKVLIPNSKANDADTFQALFWVLTPVVLIAAGTFEIVRVFRFEQGVVQRFDRPLLAMHVGLSVLWSTGAAIVLAIGIVRLIRAMRYFAIFLFAITIVKVVAVDLSYLETIYRVISFIVLGVLLLLTSFFYQKRWNKMQATGSQ